MKKQPCGWGEVYVRAFLKERDDVKNECATEQSQILVFKITIIRNLEVS